MQKQNAQIKMCKGVRKFIAIAYILFDKISVRTTDPAVNIVGIHIGKRLMKRGGQRGNL